MRRWETIGVLLLCLALVGCVACNALGGGTEEVSQQLVSVVRGDLTVTVTGSGNIGVSDEAKLNFGSGGKIDRIFVKEGDRVNKGDTLARLDTGALELALTQAKVAVTQTMVAVGEAEYNLEQLKNVLHASYDRVKLAEAQVEAAESQLEAAEQAVAEAQKQLDGATITAPFGGVVVSVGADEGDTVSVMTTVVHLIDPATMELSADVDEIDIPSVKLGQAAIVTLDALPDVQLESKVASISLMSSPAAGTVVYQVKVRFDAPPPVELRVGMSATADIIISKRSNVLLVPSRAVTQDSQGKPVVKVMVNGQMEERAVVTGISDGLQTEIVDGLKEGETVVIERRTTTSGSGLLF